jgi:hypothetical protein
MTYSKKLKENGKTYLYLFKHSSTKSPNKENLLIGKPLRAMTEA